MTTLSIRKIERDDIHIFLDMGLSGLLEQCSTKDLRESTEKYHKMHRKRSERFLEKIIEDNYSQYNKQAWVLVEHIDNNPNFYDLSTFGLVGTIELKPRSRKKLVDRSSAEIDNVYVVPKYRGKGWAQKLLETVEEHATKERIGALHLITQDNLKAAIKFYEKSGYTLDKERVWESYTLMYYSKKLKLPKKRKNMSEKKSSKKKKD